MHKRNTNGHIATTSAIRIDLRDYSDILSYDTEVLIWKNHFRLDLIIVRKKTSDTINNPLAREFRSVNIFEIKGVKSGITIPVFYKTLAYAGLYAREHSASGESPTQIRDLSANLLSRSYPRKLIHFLEKDCCLTIEKKSPGVYYVDHLGFPVYIIVTRQLPPKDFLYLSCVTDTLADKDMDLIEQLTQDYSTHRHLDHETYDGYFEQMYNEYSRTKGVISMAIRKKVKSIHEMTLSELSHEVTLKDKSLSELSHEVTLKDKSLSELSHEVTLKDKSLTELSHEVSLKDKSLSELSHEVSLKDQSISKLSHEVTLKDQSISELSHENQLQREKNAQLALEIESYRKQVDALQRELLLLKEND